MTAPPWNSSLIDCQIRLADPLYIEVIQQDNGICDLTYGGEVLLTLKLDKQDKHIRTPFELYAVDCEIKYRLHRNFRREPLAL